MRVRFDKKNKVAPWLSKLTVSKVHDIARYMRQPDGEVGRLLVMAAARDIPTINRLAPYFWRDLEIGQTSWIGHNDNLPIDNLMDAPEERVYIRFSQDEWKELDLIRFALTCPMAHAVAALLEMAISDERIVNLVAPDFVPRSIYSLKRGTVLWGASSKM